MRPPTDEPIDIRPPFAALAIVFAVILAAALGSLLTVMFGAPAKPPEARGLSETNARIDAIQDAVAELRTDLNAFRRAGGGPK